ncbi:serine/threonine protein phosphatase [Solibacillus sp. A46]|uniref:Serine/threonine protein phosphatase n=1 Tax=Solibacillus faecavium TaxID=2762221 RepID=A0ABR8XWG7_9BACL|nr:metallophosphoesterase family protein [Solibacillus faecavium]MBD8036233.1 serine/threonine protein phosphatase [Solibacillus faecavium]
MKNIFVVSDIHGHYDQFVQVLSFWDKKDTLVILGDLIDRGPQSLQVIQKVLALKDEFGDQVIVCLGNHEDMFIDYLNFPDIKQDRFFKNGGLDTIRNFQAQLPNDFMTVNPVMQVEMIKEKYAREISMITTSKIFVIIGNVLFTHAGFDSNFETIDNTSAEDFLWIRKHYLTQNRTPYINVFGHTPVHLIHDSSDVWVSEDAKYIGIDGGCYMTGQLNALHISEAGEILNIYKSVIDPPNN